MVGRRVLSSISRADALLAFLRAELDSPTESTKLRATMRSLGLSESILVSPNPQDERGNQKRCALFAKYRGAEQVFSGLRFDSIDWSRADFDRADFERQTLTCRNTYEQRYGTRKPRDVALLINRQQAPPKNGVLERALRGETLEPPLLIGDLTMSRFVILEGHNRIISYLRDPQKVSFPIQVLVGTTPYASEWSQW